jgi:hypothetical protein
LVKEPLRLLEKLVTCGVRVFRVGPSYGVGGKAAAKGKQGIDEQGRAVSVSPVPEISEEMLFAKRR